MIVLNPFDLEVVKNMRKLISVKQNHITRAIRCGYDSQTCPVALAIRDSIGITPDYVTKQNIKIYGVSIKSPKSVYDFISKFDSYYQSKNSIKPFEFILKY